MAASKQAGTEPSGNDSEALQELADAARENGIVLSSASLGRFKAYIETLLVWRTRLSLTTAATAKSLVCDHIVDSLVVAPFVEAGLRVADLGSGAGFPGVPLAVACPEASVVLVEARRKRANFLREVVRKTGVMNVRVVEERAESLGGDHIGTYDVVVSRAVWHLSEFLRISNALLKADGLAVAMKGPRGLAEAEGQQLGAFSAPEVVHYRLHGGVRRMLLVFHRAGVTQPVRLDSRSRVTLAGRKMTTNGTPSRKVRFT